MSVARVKIAAERSLYRRSFYRFACAAWEQLRGGFKTSWHVEELCDHLQAVSERRIRRMAVAIPPGLSKSTITCVLWPAWHWLHEPWHRWMFVSVDPALVKRDALESRALVQSRWYQERWGDVVQVKAGKEQADGSLEYYTTATGPGGRGLRFGTSLAAKGVGWHVHTQVFDDLLKPTDCGPAACARVREALEGTFAGRIAEPRGLFARVVQQQRLSQLDAVGYALDKGFETLILPMTYDPARYDLPDEDPRRLRRSSLWNGRTGGDRRTRPGEPLCPARVSAAEVETLRTEQGAAFLLQQEQDPTASGDRVWNVEGFKARRWAALPPGGRYSWDWDLASKGREQRAGNGDGSFTVGWLWYETESASYLVEEVRGEGAYPWQRDAIREGYERKRGHVHVEDKANGPAIQADLQGVVKGLVMVPATKDKLTRALAVSGYQDRVYWPRAPWVEDVFAEIDRFPGTPDDRGDVLSQHLARRWLPKADAKAAAAEAYAAKMRARSRR